MSAQARRNGTVDVASLQSFVNAEYDKTITPTIEEYIRIPNQSPMYDQEWATNGYQEQAVTLAVNWVKAQTVPTLTCEVIQEQGRTPVVLLEVPASGNGPKDDTVLLYGHLDKQPPMTGKWAEGLGPHTPVIRDGKLYGRGGADDGYAIFASVLAIKALKAQGVPHARCVVLIELCEESGSFDLPHYMQKLASRIGSPSLVICLDSGCGNYEQLWLTTSLRGIIAGVLRVKILEEGVHSGAASGIVPSSFRIMRQILDRVEDANTGKVLVDALNVQIPEEHITYAKQVAETLKKEEIVCFPLVNGARAMEEKSMDLLLNGTWRPTISYTGIDGLPSLKNAGNVLRTETAVNLSIRMPPTCNGKAAEAAFKKIVESNPPYGAQVTMEFEKSAEGWCVPPMAPWLTKSLEGASQAVFKKPLRAFGEGGSIPFMGMLGRQFPKTQFVITGVLGPKSNAHGPNEFLHLEMARKLTAAVAVVLGDHQKRNGPAGSPPAKKQRQN